MQRDLFDKTLGDRFDSFDRENPDIYTMFVGFTFEAINAGRARLSAWLIVNRIRWETTINTTGDEEFKISNDFIALYSRKFMKQFPEHDGFFNTKPMKRL